MKEMLSVLTPNYDCSEWRPTENAKTSIENMKSTNLLKRIQN